MEKLKALSNLTTGDEADEGNTADAGFAGMSSNAGIVSNRDQPSSGYLGNPQAMGKE